MSCRSKESFDDLPEQESFDDLPGKKNFEPTRANLEWLALPLPRYHNPMPRANSQPNFPPPPDPRTPAQPTHRHPPPCRPAPSPCPPPVPFSPSVSATIPLLKSSAFQETTAPLFGDCTSTTLTFWFSVVRLFRS
jgi:hypothetical protein